MAIYLNCELPAAVKLKNKGCPVFFENNEAGSRVLILNLMTTVEQTEEDILEKLALSDMDTDVTLLRTESWSYRRVSPDD